MPGIGGTADREAVVLGTWRVVLIEQEVLQVGAAGRLVMTVAAIRAGGGVGALAVAVEQRGALRGVVVAGFGRSHCVSVTLSFARLPVRKGACSEGKKKGRRTRVVVVVVGGRWWCVKLVFSPVFVLCWQKLWKKKLENWRL